jgi:hypothetical protein
MTILGIKVSYRPAVKNGSSEAVPISGEKARQGPDPASSTLLANLLAESSFVHLSLIDAAGRLMAEATRPLHSTGDLERLRGVLHTLARSYPRAALGRVLVQDPGGTVVLVALPNERYLVAVADKAAQPGQVLMSIGIIAAHVLEPGAPV